MACELRVSLRNRTNQTFTVREYRSLPLRACELQEAHGFPLTVRRDTMTFKQRGDFGAAIMKICYGGVYACIGIYHQVESEIGRYFFIKTENNENGNDDIEINDPWNIELMRQQYQQRQGFVSGTLAEEAHVQLSNGLLRVYSLMPPHSKDPVVNVIITMELLQN